LRNACQPLSEFCVKYTLILAPCAIAADVEISCVISYALLVSLPFVIGVLLLEYVVVPTLTPIAVTAGCVL